MSEEERDQTEELREFGEKLRRENEERAAAEAKKAAAAETEKAPEAEDVNKAVEQTVEDLKQKIKEISADDPADNEADAKSDETLNIPQFHLNDDQKEKIKEVRKDAEKTVNDTITTIKEKASDFTGNVDFSKTLKYLKENAFKAVDAAKVKINEIAENPELKEKTKAAADKASEAAKSVREGADRLFSEEQKQSVSDSLNKMGDTVREKYNEVMTEERKEKLQENLNKAGNAVSDGLKSVSKSASEFAEKPEVKDALDKSKRFAADGVEKLKGLFHKN